MSTTISQLNLDYDALNDRMLLSVSTADRQEYQVLKFRDRLGIHLSCRLPQSFAVSNQTHRFCR